MEIQNLVLNLFKKLRKNPNLRSFLPKWTFSKRLWLSSTVVVLQHSKVKDLEWTGHRIKNYSIAISRQKSFNQSAQFIESFARYTWFKSPMIYTASLIFDHAHPITI